MEPDLHWSRFGSAVHCDRAQSPRSSVASRCIDTHCNFFISYREVPNHLVKVVNPLARAGFLDAVRGRGGGLKLRHAPSTISVGAVIRKTEEGFELADCTACVIAPACGLTAVLAQGTLAMLKVFDRYTIADLVEKRSTLRALLGG